VNRLPLGGWRYLLGALESEVILEGASFHGLSKAVKELLNRKGSDITVDIKNKRSKEEEMNITHIVYDHNTFGITQRSLKMLRDTLAEKIHNRIVVVEVPTNDICCGYFIFDWEWQNATWTGDGFRTDKGGEGGAGYCSAEILLKIFGIWPIQWEMMDLDKICALSGQHVENELKKIAQKIAESIDNEDFKLSYERQPEYIK
jgi:hypothetical protein